MSAHNDTEPLFRVRYTGPGGSGQRDVHATNEKQATEIVCEWLGREMSKPTNYASSRVARG